MADIKVEKICQYALSKDNKPKALFSKIGVVGCGTVGQSIARLVSARGIDVVFIETNEERIKNAFKRIEDNLDSMINRWGMTSSEKRAILSRIEGTLDCTKLQECDLVFESVRSKSKKADVLLVKEVFQKIEQNVKRDTIIATNATILGVTEIASVLKYPDRAVSIHFLVSQPDAPVVEASRGIETSDEVSKKVEKFIKLLGKRLVPIAESPGGISARLVSPLINEACQMFLEGVGTMDEIDDMMTKGLGLRLGPFAMADKIGLDKILLWLDGLYSEFGDQKYKAHTVLKNHVRARHLGRKTRKGFYEYDAEGKRINAPKYYNF
ncbi:MAG: NAD-binding protein [Bacteroidales bacterium]|nr:NAD-binding protein [Bacteroidales bacterium]